MQCVCSQIIYEKKELNALFPQKIMNDKKRYAITNLLPYNPNKKIHSRLSDGLKQYLLLLIAAKEAITDFMEGKLSSFDSLVGENACQIRSTLLSVIANQFPVEDGTLLREITSIVEKVEQIIKSSDSHKGIASLGEYIKTNFLGIKINSMELFLICSYILTKVRVIMPNNPSKFIVRNEITETKKIKEISLVGSSFARDLVKRLRNFVSSISVKFVQEIAKKIDISESVLHMVSHKYCISHDKFGRLKCLPCFWYTSVLMRYSLEVELPIVIHMKQIYADRNYEEGIETTFYYKVIDGIYQEVPSYEISRESPALIVLGSACRKSHEFPDLIVWRKELLSYDPIELILAYAASHRQYPDESKDVLVEDSGCLFFDNYKKKAYEWGCALSNPSLFFLVHAYCDKLANVTGSSDV